MKDRPTIDIVIITFTITVCGFLLLAGAGLTVLAILQPEAAATREPVENALISAITTIIGALLGLVAGRARGNAEGEKQEKLQKSVTTP